MRQERDLEQRRARGEVGAEEESACTRVAAHAVLVHAEQKVQREAEPKGMESALLVSSATGMDDVNEIIRKFKTKDETRDALLLTKKQAEARIKQLQREREQLTRTLEQKQAASWPPAAAARSTTRSTTWTRRSALRASASRICARAAQTDLTLENRACAWAVPAASGGRCQLVGCGYGSYQRHFVEAPPDAMAEVETKVARLVKQVQSARADERR